MACSIIRNQAGQIKSILAPNSKESILYKDILDIPAIAGDKEKALRMWAVAYTPEFKELHGDWENGQSLIDLDANGEPVVGLVSEMFYKPGINYNLSEDFITFEKEKERFSKEFKVKFGGSVTRDERTAQDIVRKINALSLTGYAELYTFNDTSGVRAYQVLFHERNYDDMRDVTGFSTEDPDYQAKKRQVNEVLDRITENVKGIDIQWVHPRELNPSEHPGKNLRAINAYAKGHTVYLVEGRVTPDIAMEEVLHFVVELLRVDNPSLNNRLFDQAKLIAPELWQRIQDTYTKEKGFTISDQKNELVTRVLQQEYAEEIKSNPAREYSDMRKILNDIYKWFSNLLNKVFVQKGYRTVVDFQALPLNTTFNELAVILNAKNVEIEAFSIDKTLYNLEESENKDLDKELPVPGEEEKKGDNDWQKKVLERQLERVDKQLEYLDLAQKNFKTSSSQTETIQKLRKQLVDYRNILINTPNKTRRVSRVIGQTDATGAENYANFGTFIHNMLEELQVEAMKSSPPVHPIVHFEREMFNARYQETMDNPKTAFEFKGMTQEDVYKMAKGVIGFLGDAYSRGHVLIPEITLISKDPVMGSIVGRVDFMAIDKDGKVMIYDLKTTRVNAGQLPQNKLSKQFAKDTFLPGVTPEFGLIKTRSKFMEYDAQLTMYERMLGQSGIEVIDKIIVSLVYANKHKGKAVSGKEFEFSRAEIHRFNEEYYAYRTDTEFDEEGNVLNQRRVLRKEFERIRNAAKAAVFIEGEEETENVESTVEAVNMFEVFPGVQLDEFVETVIEGIDKQLSFLRDKLKKTDEYLSDPKVKEYYQNRSKQLYTIKEEMLKANDEEKLALAKGMKLSAAVAALNLSAQQVEEEAVRINNLELSLEEKLRRLAQVKDQAQNLDEIFSIIIEAAERNGLTSSDLLIQTSTASRSALRNSISKYRQQGEQIMIDYIQQAVPENLIGDVYRDRGQYLEGKIRGLERDIQELEDPEWKLPAWQVHKRKMYTPEQVNQIRLEKLAEKKAELKQAIADQSKKSITRKDIEDYVYALMNNPDAAVYIGSNISVGRIGFGISDIISNSSNPELIVYAVFDKLRNLTVEAENRAMNNFYEMNFDGKVKNFISRKGGETAANAAIREKRTVVYHNEDGTTYTREHYSFKNPVAQDYFTEIDTRKRLISNKRSLLKTLRRQSNADPSNVELKTQVKDLEAELNLDVKLYNEWLRDNTEREYIDEWYDLTISLPAGVQEQLDEIDQDIQSIRSTKVGAEELLNESELEKLHELELKRNKIYQNAISTDADYQKKMERYRELKVREQNWGLYNKIRAEKIATYGQDSAEFKQWEKLNKIRRPSAKYYESIQNIYERIEKIIGTTNSEMKLLLEQRSKIRRKYKMNGTFYTGDMDPQDIALYDEIEEKIEEIRLEASKSLPIATRKKLAKQSERLSKLREQKQSQNYINELNKRVNELELAANRLREIENVIDYVEDSTKEKLTEDYIAAEQNYNNIEQQFEQWYNNNHREKYDIGAFRRGDSLNPVPKSFHFEYVPNESLDESYFEEVLHGKFTFTRPTEAAKNPRYQLTPEGYPMPKGLQLKDNRWEISSNNKYISQDFIKLTQNKEDYDFYNWLVMDNFIAKQNDTVGRKLGFLFPGVEMNKVDNIKQFGLMEGLRREYWETANEYTWGKSPVDINTNEYGTTANMRVRFKHNYPMDATVTTTNGITAVGMWMVEREINHEMGKADIAFSAIIDAMEGMRDYVKDTEKLNELNKAIELVTFERDKFIYGQRMKGGEKEINTMKGLRQFMKVVSFGRLGFDFAAQVGNMLSGNVQTFLNTQKGSYTQENLVFAKKKTYDILMNMVKDYGKVSDISFETKMVRFMNPTQKELSELVDLNTKEQLDRFLTKSFDLNNISYALQDKGETEISVTTMAAVMDHHKFPVFDLDAQGDKQYDADGNVKYKMVDGEIETVNGWDAFAEDENGRVVTRKDVDITEQQVKMMRNKIYSSILKAQGNYAARTSTHISSTMVGVLMEYFKKYFVPMALRRFGKHQENYEGMNYAAGWYRILFDMFRNYGFKEGIKAMIPGANRSEVNEYYRTGALQAGREILTAFAMTMLYGYLRGLAYSDDDDETELNWMQIQIMRTFAKVISESRSMVPAPYIGSVDTYIDSFSNFTSVFKEGKTMWKLIENSLSLVGYEIFGEAFEEAALYQRAYGMYEAGDPKALKNFHDLIGYDNIVGIFSPEYKLKEQFRNK